jgi:hypothetical protein
MSRLGDEGRGGRATQESKCEAEPIDDRRPPSSPEQEWQLTKEGYKARNGLLEAREAQWQAKQENWRIFEESLGAGEASWKAKEMVWQSRERDLEAKVADQAKKENLWEKETARATADKKKLKAKEKQLEKRLRDIKIRWKSTAKELDGLRAQGRGFYQITDAYLEELIARLRYNIRNFAIQYFSGALAKPLRIVPNLLWENCMEPITEGTGVYLDHLKSLDQRASVVQAFLWRILVRHVFNQFRWAGSASHSILELYEALENPTRASRMSTANADGVKRFHIWRGTTVGLLLGSMDDEKLRSADVRVEKFKSDLFEDVDACLGLMRSGRHEDFMNSFRDLIDEAIILDKEISQQVSCVVWTFENKAGSWTLDPISMELESGKSPAGGDSEVAFVVCPGVLKQGKSSGEDFDKITWLLKMEVTCEAPERS